MSSQDVFPPDFGGLPPDWMTSSQWAPPRRGRARSLAILVAIALLVALAGGEYIVSTPGQGSPTSRLAGYTWCCSANEVSARWVVPKVIPPLHQSSEALWVGVQNGYGTHPELFLQVGVLIVDVTGLTPEYFAFWSDATKGFRAQILQVLVPGDVVRAQLVYRRGVWIARIRDGSALGTKVVRGLASPAGDFAEWFEEDPPVSAAGTHFFAMPDTARTHFENVRVNGKHPKHFEFTSQGFTTDRGVAYQPTGLSRSDGFTITH